MNNKIIIAAVVITSAGVLNAWLANRPITGIIIGGYILLLILAVMDTVGGPFSMFANALAMVAVLYTLIGTDPTTHKPIFPWQELIAFIQGKKA